MIKIELIEKYLNRCACDIAKTIDKRIDKFFDVYKDKMFGKQFFLDIDYGNVLIDLIYFRDETIKAHLSICKQYKLKTDCFAVEHIKWYNERLNNIELKSFLSVLNLKEPGFHYNEKTKKEINDEMKRILDKILMENINTNTK